MSVAMISAISASSSWPTGSAAWASTVVTLAVRTTDGIGNAAELFRAVFTGAGSTAKPLWGLSARRWCRPRGLGAG